MCFSLCVFVWFYKVGSVKHNVVVSDCIDILVANLHHDAAPTQCFVSMCVKFLLVPDDNFSYSLLIKQTFEPDGLCIKILNIIFSSTFHFS